MAAKTLEEFYVEYRARINPVTGQQNLWCDITDQVVWDAATRAAEEKFTSVNSHSDEITWLDSVLHESCGYMDEVNRCHYFKQAIKHRLTQFLAQQPQADISINSGESFTESGNVV